jgi:AraC-like DNA-binding protein
VVLDAARVSTATGGPWSHDEHEHPDIQVTVHLPAQGASMGAFESSTRIVPSHAPHKGGAPSGVASVVFHFTPQMLDGVAEEMLGEAHFELHRGDVCDPFIAQVAEAALQEISSCFDDSLLLDQIAHVVAGRLLRSYAILPEGKRLVRTRLTARQLNTLREFIESRFDTAGGVRKLAAVIGLGPQRFTAVLKASMGLTPHAYVTQLRMMRASRLLQQSGLTLAEIALTLGFASQSHFGSVFRRFFGVTPQQYRKRASL